MLDKTIVSLVTAPINQNIAIIRISGEETYRIISEIFTKKINIGEKKRIVLGKIKSNSEVIDQVLITCFYEPNSFTGEDLVEINCHGNIFIVEKILGLIIERGAELASKGEFTKRAFFNNKLNLSQAKSINDLIKAPSFFATKISLHNLEKKNYLFLEEIEEQVLSIITNLIVNIDYPEYDGAIRLTTEDVYFSFKKIIQKLEKIKKASKNSKIYHNGIKIAVVSRPNTGKSTLSNIFFQREKSIVSSIPGTTRDVIEGEINFYGIPITFLDTAGIHQTSDKVEMIGIKRTWTVLKKADLILFLLDNSRPWNLEDELIFKKIEKKNFIIVVNKIDISNKLVLPENIFKKNIVKISAKKGEISSLEKEIRSQFINGDLEKNLEKYDYLMINSTWQEAIVNHLLRKSREVAKKLKEKNFLDAVLFDLEFIYLKIRELSGKKTNEDLIEAVFSKFCLGK